MKKKQEKNNFYYQAIGRRKEAIARVRLYVVDKEGKARVNNKELKKGQILINNEKLLEEVFKKKDEKNRILSPLRLTDQEERFAISILVKGGGREGQLGAIVHGLARALVAADERFKKVLRENGLLTRDPRVKERRKVGTGGKARREKQSPKR